MGRGQINTHTQTNTRTCRILDRLGPEGRVGENQQVKRLILQVLRIGPLARFGLITLEFTGVNQQNAKVTPISCKFSVAVKSTNDNLNTHDYEY